jgi:predicted enzyme related to lactoylglutathione lyase
MPRRNPDATGILEEKNAEVHCRLAGKLQPPQGHAGYRIQRQASVPPQSGTNAFVCSMEVTDFDSVAQKIPKHGGQIDLPKFVVPGVCWQGYFVDSEGNTFGLFQPDPQAK